MAGCIHERGDWLGEVGYWLCADCYARLSSRPRTYGKGSDPGAPPQVITWQATVAIAGCTSLSVFLMLMAQRFRAVTNPQLGLEQSYDFAIEALQACDASYGAEGYDWSPRAGRELVQIYIDENFEMGRGAQ